MRIAAETNGSRGVTTPASLTGTLGWIAMFATAGTLFLIVQPQLSIAFPLALVLSLSIATFSVAGLGDIEALDRTRAMVRLMSPILMASLLWLAILAGHTMAAEHGPTLSSILALALFAGLVGFEAAVATFAALLVSSILVTDPATGVAVQLADKYAGLAGDIAT